MTRAERRRRGTALIVACILSLQVVGASAALAEDGEVIGRGSDIAGNIYDNGSHARFNFSNLGDCPVGISACWVEVKFRWKGNQWYSTWNDGAWMRLPAGQDYATYCANGTHRYEAYSRLRWQASTTKTVEMWGQYENVTEVGGTTIVPKFLSKFLFNVTNGTGLRLGTKTRTVTSTTDTSAASLVATSGPSWVTTSC